MTAADKPIPARPRNISALPIAQPAPVVEPPIEEPSEETPTGELPPLGQRTLTDIHEKLCKPFALWAVEVKPGATTQDKTRALAMAYADARVYQTRLDRLAGPEGWSVEYLPIGERAIRCRLTILGVVREDVGECAQAGDENAWTSATMQAFKRACAAFGVGRYLYSLPKPWVEYDQGRRQIKDPSGAARLIYEQAGLLEK
jgi:hypothetical protein